MEALACFAKGFRTLSAVLAFIVMGLLGVLGTVDLTPVVSLFVKDPQLLGAAMVMIGVLFGFLRYLTTTPICQHEQRYEDRPRSLDSGV